MDFRPIVSKVKRLVQSNVSNRCVAQSRVSAPLRRSRHFSPRCGGRHAPAMLSVWLVNQEMSIDYRPNDPSVLADPFPIYQRMRDEDPAHWSPVLKAWVLTRYEDVKRVCLDSRMSSDRLRPFFATLSPGEAEHIAQLMRVLALWMVFRDPPEHTRLRRLAAKVFNVRSINLLRPDVEAITRLLLESLDGRSEFDFIGEFAGPLPALVIMHMLGVPRAELARLKRLSDEMALFIGSARDTPDKYRRAEAATGEMAGIFRDLIAMRRAKPQRDLLSELIQADDEGERLS